METATLSKPGIESNTQSNPAKVSAIDLAKQSAEQVKRGRGRPPGSKSKTVAGEASNKTVTTGQPIAAITPATPEQKEFIRQSVLSILQTWDLIQVKRTNRLCDLLNIKDHKRKEFIDLVTLSEPEQKSIPDLSAIVCEKHGWHNIAPEFFLGIAVLNYSGRQISVTMELRDLANKIAKIKNDQKVVNASSTQSNKDINNR